MFVISCILTLSGLETLDLHGNVLVELPLGLRRLELLTALNVVSLLSEVLSDIR
jgi:hypothetical protein